MIEKIAFKYGMAKIAPKVIATLATSAGMGDITVICHKLHSKIVISMIKKLKMKLRIV